VRPQSDEDWRQARLLVEEYAATLPVDLAFQDFAHELDNLAGKYASPHGAFLLAEENGARIGCVGLRQFAEGAGEMKRLYVTPAATGRGAGRLLAEAIVAAARDIGYASLLLDTLPKMTPALRLYESLGFKPIPAYRFNPVPDAVFLRLDLTDSLKPVRAP
jgi:GNAT superfamily N-acetyltransferase